MNPVAKQALKLLGEVGLWRAVARVHAPLYRMTDGRIGHRSGKLTNLLLTTTGRRSGLPRTVPLTYLAEGDSYVLVASNGGSDRHPAWWLNLEAKPEATVQVGAQQIKVRASRAEPRERQRLWPRLKTINPFYAAYEQITEREIPVVILRPR